MDVLQKIRTNEFLIVYLNYKHRMFKLPKHRGVLVVQRTNARIPLCYVDGEDGLGGGGHLFWMRRSEKEGEP